MGHLIHQSPQAYGFSTTRWTLRQVLKAAKWLRLTTLAGLSQLLHRLKIHWKRARQHVHSPDPHYIEKLRRIWVLINPLPWQAEQLWIGFEDEFTYYRHPSLAWAYELAGKAQPLAELGWHRNAFRRIIATLHLWTGQVVFRQCEHVDRLSLVTFYEQLVSAFPDATLLYLVQDNWPVHYHPDVLAALQPQTYLPQVATPRNWPAIPSRKARYVNLPIQCLWLPSYASWTNPIEKLWRMLKQEVLHLHRFGDDWNALKLRVTAFLDQFANGSPELLRYVGLNDPKKLYRTAFSS